MLPLIIFGCLAFVHMHYLDNTKRQRQVELALTEAGALGTYPVKVHAYTHHLHCGVHLASSISPLAFCLLNRCRFLNSFSNVGSRSAPYRQRNLDSGPFPAMTPYMSPTSVCRSFAISTTCRPPPVRALLRPTDGVASLVSFWEVAR